MKQKLLMVTVVILVSGCGNIGHSYVQWPVDLSQVSNFSDSQKQLVMDVIDQFNNGTNQTLITTSNTQAVSSIQILDEQSIGQVPSSLSDVASGLATIAGQAAIQTNLCTVKILDMVAQNDDLLKSVLLHELGHCAGLVHVPEQGEVMYKEATPFSQITQDAIERFFAQITASVNS